MIRPIHFLLPILLPVYSSLGFLLGAASNESVGGFYWRRFGKIAITTAMLIQIAFNVTDGIDVYEKKLNEARESNAVIFYREFKSNFLDEIPREQELRAYRDVRVYLPENGRLDESIKWGLIDYDYIAQNEFDLLFFWRQRILDYTQDGILESAADPDAMKKTIDLMADAKAGAVVGYEMLYADSFASVFISASLYDAYFGN